MLTLRRSLPTELNLTLSLLLSTAIQEMDTSHSSSKVLSVSSPPSAPYDLDTLLLQFRVTPVHTLVSGPAFSLVGVPIQLISADSTGTCEGSEDFLRLMHLPMCVCQKPEFLFLVLGATFWVKTPVHLSFPSQPFLTLKCPFPWCVGLLSLDKLTQDKHGRGLLGLVVSGVCNSKWALRLSVSFYIPSLCFGLPAAQDHRSFHGFLVARFQIIL